jgi:hypothetical protein
MQRQLNVAQFSKGNSTPATAILTIATTTTSDSHTSHCDTCDSHTSDRDTNDSIKLLSFSCFHRAAFIDLKLHSSSALCCLRRTAFNVLFSTCCFRRAAFAAFVMLPSLHSSCCIRHARCAAFVDLKLSSSCSFHRGPMHCALR